MKNLNIQIKSGSTTCAYEPEKFCKYLGTVKFGQIAICRLFPSEDNPYTVLNGEEWILRCDMCLQAEKPTIEYTFGTLDKGTIHE